MDVAEQLKNMAESLKSGDAGSAPGAQGDGSHHANQAGDDGNRHSQQNDSTTQSQQSDQPQPNGSAQGDDQQRQPGDAGQTILGDIANFARAQAEKAIEQVMQETLNQIDQIRLDLFRPDQE
jgi:hypothetical protein